MGIDALVAAAVDAFGTGAADAGAATIGAGAAEAGAGAAATLPGASIADIVGSGEGLFGGAPGLAGTLEAGGSGLSIADLAGGTAGLGAAGTAADFLAAPGASAFDAAAATPTAIGGASAFDSGLPSSVANANASIPGATPGGVATPGSAGAAGGAPSAVPPGASAGSVAAPPGVAGSPDATAGSSVFNTGTSAVPGSPGATPSPSIASLTGSPGATPSSSIASLTGAPASNATVPGAAGYSSIGGPGGPAPLGGGSSVSDSSGVFSNLADKFSPSNLASSAVDSLTKNPLGVALGAGGLGYSIYEGTQQTANEKALTADAQTATANSASLANQGQGLVNYLTSGTLPAGYQTQVTQAINSAIAQAKSNAASQGLSTDPTQNTALAAELEQIQNQQPILQEQIAAQLAGTGTSLINAGATSAGLSGQLYQALVANDTTQAANAGKAIASLAAALSGKSQATIGSTPITVG
jgi:hypothetical protein